MDIIYSPTGKAKEYADLAINIYKGCTHGCKYCYATNPPWIDPQTYFSNPNPKTHITDRLTKDCRILSKRDDVPEILLSFIGDPYQPIEQDLQYTREALKVLIQFNLPFTILTKGGALAMRDFDLLAQSNKGRYGSTVVFLDQRMADEWEPRAAKIKSRILAMEEARCKGIPTWVSLEPVIDPDQALEVIRELHPIVDHWKIGKINHHRGIETAINWPKFKDQATDVLESLGADYLFKQSLINI